MEAIICDSCGKMVGQEECKKVSLETTKTFGFGYFSEHNQVRDLCPDCWDNVSEFIDGKDKK